MTEELDPRDALALAERTRDRMLERAATPPWYAPLYGLCCGLIVAGGGLPQPWGLLLISVGILSVALLYWRWTQSSGLSVNGYRAGATRVIAIGLAVALIALMIAGLVGRETLGLIWSPFACGAAGALIAAFASAAWDRAWRAQIRREGGQ
jgi:4-hydroxybenzoate polyprenyltransferase